MKVRLFQFMKPAKFVDIQPGESVRDLLERCGLDIESMACDVKVNNGTATFTSTLSEGDVVQVVPRVAGGVLLAA